MIKQSGSFIYTTNDAGDSMEITLHGDIDHHSAAPLRASIDRLLYEKRPHTLILNLSRVDFMDSSGLGLILGRFNLMGELGGEMRLRAPGERVSRILRLAAVERLITIEPAESDKPSAAADPAEKE